MKSCRCGWQFPALVLSLSHDSYLGRNAFFCPNCDIGWVAEVSRTKKDGIEFLYMSDPEEEPTLTPSKERVRVEEIVADIEKRGTLFECGGFARASDGNWHFFLNGRVLIGPLCGDSAKEAKTPKEMPDDALICMTCVKRVKSENDLRRAAQVKR